jgi:hypothetical protein
VIGLIERGADEVVHRGVGNHKGLFAVALDVQHTRERAAGLRDQEAPRLQQQAALEASEGAFYGGGVLAHLGGGVEAARVVINAQASAGIDGLEVDALALELAQQLAHPLHRRAKRRCRANLRADVEADAIGLKPALAGRALVNPSAWRISTPNLCSRRPVEM